MNNEDYINLVESISKQVLDKIDFKRGIVQECNDEMRKNGCVLDVRWKMNVHIILYMNRFQGSCWYYVERNGEKVSPSYYSRKFDDQIFHSLQHLVNEVDNGDFNYKKTISEKIAEIIHERQLTSYMNNTKWKEFIHAMTEEMSIEIPCEYKTLLEENRDSLSFCTGYDIESFNFYYFKSIEWVKVKPKFYERKRRGKLIEDAKIYHDAEQEFLDLMNKYSIPYEYDEVNEAYTIYGYK